MFFGHPRTDPSARRAQIYTPAPDCARTPPARLPPVPIRALRNVAGVAQGYPLTLDRMTPRRIYIDTSVVGGCLDPEFREASVQLFEQFRTGRLIAVVSDLLRSEIAPAPEEVQAVLDAVPVAHLEDVLMTGEAKQLAERYIQAGVITRKLLTDAMHIATATVHRAEVLASWNFKHIVNVRRIHGYNSVNRREGRPFLEIKTPAEVIGHGK